MDFLVASMLSHRALSVLASTWLASCAGDGMGLDSNGRPLLPAGPPGGVLTADLASIQQHVFTPICSVCHAGAGAPQGLRLDATNSYALLVGIPSTEVPAILRVKPGDPDRSYIVQKLEGHAAVGAQMPFGGPPLPSAAIAVIRQWITDGAPRAVAASMVEHFTVAAAAPAAGDVLAEPPMQIVVEFSAEIDQTRLDASSLRLEREVPGAPEASAPVRFRIWLPLGNPRSILLSPFSTLADGHYRLVVDGPPATGVSAVFGERLSRPSAQQSEVVITEFDVARLE
jgi:hypothetical protein